jgi:hypothetical protein
MKVETYVTKDWEESEAGLLLAENDEWILVKHIPADYVIDGYRLYKKKFVENRERDETERQIERVLKLKGVDAAMPEGFEFSDTIGLLQWVESKYGLFEFQDDDESELFYGTLQNVENGSLSINMITAKGEEDPEFDFEFEIDKIRILEFETDYHLSIKLLWDDKKKTN